VQIAIDIRTNIAHKGRPAAQPRRRHCAIRGQPAATVEQRRRPCFLVRARVGRDIKDQIMAGKAGAENINRERRKLCMLRHQPFTFIVTLAF
jgi:hypothetical protein